MSAPIRIETRRPNPIEPPRFDREHMDHVRSAQRKIEGILGHSTIPNRFAGVMLKNLTIDRLNHHAIESARQFAFRFPVDRSLCMYLWGSTGAGKSTLAWLCALAQIRNLWSSAIGGKVAVILEDLRKKDERITWLYRTADLLIADDLDLHRFSEWDEQLWFDLMTYRHDQQRGCVLVSNRDPDSTFESFRDNYQAAALLDRIDHSGPVVELAGSSRRATWGGW